MSKALKEDDSKVVDSVLKKKLTDALVNKLSFKYKDIKGSGHTITTKVNNFMSRYNKPLTEQTVIALDKDIFNALNTTLCITPPPKGPQRPKEVRPATSKNDNNPRRNMFRLQRSTAPEARTTWLKKLDEEREWCEIVKFKTMLYKEYQQQEHLRKQRERSFLRTTLLHQMQEKQVAKLRETSELNAFLSMEREQQKKYDDLEKQNTFFRKNLQLRRKREILRQCYEKRSKKHLQDKTEKEDDANFLERCKAEMELDRKDKANRRKLEQKYMRDQIEESELKRAMEKVQAAKETETDKQKLDQFIQQYDKSEQDKTTMKNQQHLETSQIIKEACDKAIFLKKQIDQSEDEWAMKLQNLEVERIKTEDMEKEKTFKRVQTAIKKFYDSQVERKVGLRLKQKEEKVKDAQMLAENAKITDIEEKLAKSAYKVACQKNAEYLKRQMYDKNGGIKCSKTYAYFYKTGTNKTLMLTDNGF